MRRNRKPIDTGCVNAALSARADLARADVVLLAPKYDLDTVSQIAIDEDWSALRLKRAK